MLWRYGPRYGGRLTRLLMLNASDYASFITTLTYSTYMLLRMLIYNNNSTQHLRISSYASTDNELR